MEKENAQLESIIAANIGKKIKIFSRHSYYNEMVLTIHSVKDGIVSCYDGNYFIRVSEISGFVIVKDK